MNHNENKLEIGTTYLTPDGVSVTPIKQLETDRALFVSDNFYSTPFIAWTYSVTGTNEIILYRGDYYPTLDDALADVSNSVQDTPKMLEVCFFCPSCEESTIVTTPLSGSVLSISERLSDNQFCHICHRRCDGASHIELADKDNIYTFPLWRGLVNRENS